MQAKRNMVPAKNLLALLALLTSTAAFSGPAAVRCRQPRALRLRSAAADDLETLWRAHSKPLLRARPRRPATRARPRRARAYETRPGAAPTRSRGMRSRTFRRAQVGSGGVKPSHKNSLLELLGAHGHVCVKINGARDADAVAKAAGELAGDGAVILLTKSNSVLYGKPQP